MKYYNFLKLNHLYYNYKIILKIFQLLYSNLQNLLYFMNLIYLQYLLHQLSLHIILLINLKEYKYNVKYYVS